MFTIFKCRYTASKSSIQDLEKSSWSSKKIFTRYFKYVHDSKRQVYGFKNNRLPDSKICRFMGSNKVCSWIPKNMFATKNNF
jgi:hypothetical protein